eukprot:Gb_21027 [translate_table: standard]
MASLLCILVLALYIGGAAAGHDYGEALSKSILFYEAQRSGRLPANQRVKWRSDSGLTDGKSNGVDLVGGYYDAGDNVKFGLPMAFTVTMLSWSVIEYGQQLARSGELGYAMDAIRWGTDYFIKAHPQPEVLYGEVGDGTSDHYCWQRPEDMSTSRQAYRIDPNNPGSDLAGETAAAMAAASIVFKQTDRAYANELLNHAIQLFAFANQYRGKYDSSITVAQQYYGSKSGYADELLWAATWLHQATGEAFYLNYLVDNAGPLGGTGWAMTEFSWDVKYAGVQVLASKFLLQNKGTGQSASVLESYQDKAEYFMCACIQKGSNNVQRTPGGLLYWQKWNNIQFVTSAAFLLTLYSDYLSSAGKTLQCPGGNVQPTELLSLAKSQIDYILGDNPRATSYMVGYGANYPLQVHHRASSIVSIKENPTFVSCKGGYANWFSRESSDPNILMGALVGGPDQNDDFADERDNYEQTEPATYNNGPLVGVLARFNGGGGYNQLLPSIVPPPGKHWPSPSPPTKPSPRPSQPKPSPSPLPPAKPKPHPSKPKPSPASQNGSPLAMFHDVTSSWQYEGRTYYRYATSITNKSHKTIKSLKLSIQGFNGPFWGLSKIGDYYTFPQWLRSLSPGQSFDFVYIQAAPQASISVSSYNMN